MGPFQGVQITTTKMHLGGHDLTTIAMGSIQPELMTDPHALMGVFPGIDQKMIRGDYTEEVNGLRNTTIKKTETLEVYLDSTVKLNSDSFLKVQGNSFIKVQGDEKTEIHGDRNLHVFGHDDEIYAVHREIHEPYQFEIKGFEMATKVTNLDLIGADYGVKALAMETCHTKIGGAGHEMKWAEAQEKSIACLSRVVAVMDGTAGGVVKLELEGNIDATMSSDHLG